jgi:aspartyl-tRNA(Asn)/glutamyl-tRNA(Gln) amidotransferase subunit A
MRETAEPVTPIALPISDVSDLLKARKISATELMFAILRRIDLFEPEIKAFVDCWPAEALAEAAKADREIDRGEWRGPLHGVPVAVKDIFDVAGKPTLAGTAARHDHVAAETATVVTKLRDAGAIIVGKTTTHEIAFGVMTPPTRNPWDTRRSAGGSSGGSAAAVAAGEVFAAMGSDTGGSIRGPAALCGVVGLKPTFGRVSKFGILVNTWSFDTIGPLTRTVRDAAIVLEAIAGFDEKDSTTIPVPTGDYAGGLDGNIRGVRIGLPRNYFFRHVDRAGENAVRDVAERLAALGAEVSEVTLPLSEAYHAVMYAACLPEIATYHEENLRARAEQYGPGARHALLAGSLMRATEYLRAQRVRQAIIDAWREVYAGIDVLLAPTHPTTAPDVNQTSTRWDDGEEEDVLSVYSRLTAPASVTGYPAISVPCGTDGNGLPYGAQIIGRPFEESLILRVADAYERVAGWTELLRAGPLRPY